MTTGATATQQSKSGLRQLKPGEILFNDGDSAESLYIIQKGQVRLFKPKGKGFIEIGILRAGEVIGEMAFFDEDGSGKKRSCSASALTAVDIIEISFVAFGKTMQTLNPWFKTIINTLANRLRKANTRTKELEDNQASVTYGGKHAGYEFMKPIEVMRVLGTFFLVFKAHGELQGQALMVNRKALTLYTNDMYQIMEVKLECILEVLVQLGWMEIKEDSDKLPNIFLLKNIEGLRQIFIYYNSERHIPDEKKLRMTDKCELILAKMLEKGESLVSDIPNIKINPDAPPPFTKRYFLSPLIEEFKSKNVNVSIDSLSDAQSIGVLGEASVNDGKTFVEVDYKKLLKMYPIIRFMNSVKKSNLEKGGGGA